MLMQLPEVPVYGEPLMSLLHTATHMAFSHRIIHTQTHVHTAHACPPSSVYSIASTNADTQYTRRNFTGKSNWQIKECTYRDEPFRMFENLPKDVFLKTNYPCGCVKEWPLLFPAHIRIPQIIEGCFFISPSPCELNAVYLTFKAALPKKKKEIISKINFLLFSAVRRCE